MANNERKRSFKETAKDVWTEVKPFALMVSAMGVGYILGEVTTEMKIAVGMKRFHDAGLVKFFNSDNVEINVEEATKIAAGISRK